MLVYYPEEKHIKELPSDYAVPNALEIGRFFISKGHFIYDKIWTNDLFTIFNGEEMTYFMSHAGMIPEESNEDSDDPLSSVLVTCYYYPHMKEENLKIAAEHDSDSWLKLKDQEVLVIDINKHQESFLKNSFFEDSLKVEEAALVIAIAFRAMLKAGEVPKQKLYESPYDPDDYIHFS